MNGIDPADLDVKAAAYIDEGATNTFQKNSWEPLTAHMINLQLGLLSWQREDPVDKEGKSTALSSLDP